MEKLDYRNNLHSTLSSVAEDTFSIETDLELCEIQKGVETSGTVLLE
jgi:hypothetical protein